jgi:pyrroline-5-carboxylate reductase
MMRSFISHNAVEASDIIASDLDKYNLLKVKEEMNVVTTDSRKYVVDNCDIIILAERAQHYAGVAKDIRKIIRPDQILVSTAPNMPISAVEDRFGDDIKIVRAKPNTPAIVGESMTGICHNELVTHEEFNEICALMRCFGVVEEVPEELMDVVIAVSSSSPAYVFMFIEAMADAASADGMTRDQAYQFAAQAVYGSAKMILETHKHPGQLKDMVCQPGGTTLEAIRVLESHKLRSSIFEAMKACVSHAKKM